MTPEELDVEFPLGPDSLPQPGVPRGRVEKFTFSASRVFPGTVRDYYVYVPAQYDPAKPACVMVVQDGYDHIRPERRWRIPTILDNLLQKGDIPVCIGIFIDPGTIPAEGGGALRSNRSFEYDSLSDRYTRFLLDEILPEAGRSYNLSGQPGDRLIMGGSSGALCAFTVAWHRPDQFQRVLSIVGSYTALRGGHNVASLVRLTEPKPLRIFLESGRNDFVVFAGDWWAANLDMLSALRYSGYEVNHTWAEQAGHDDYHGSSIFPDALRWIWQGHPRPIQAGVNSRQPVAQVLIPGEDWQAVGGDYQSAGVLAANARGEIHFADEASRRIGKIGSDGRATVFADEASGITDLAFAPDGKLHACQPEFRRLTVWDQDGRTGDILDGLAGHSVAIAANGNRYVTEPASRRIWLVPAHGERRIVDETLGSPHFARLVSGQSQLVVTDAQGRMASLFRIQPDGALADRAPFFRLNLPDEETASGAGQIAVNPAGRICFATALGLQFADPNGPVAAILPTPHPREIAGVAFGGPNFDELYVSCRNKIYRRRIRNEPGLWR